MDRRPPLAVSPRRLRPRRNLRSAPSDQTPPASIRTKPKTPLRSSLPCYQLLKPEHNLISSELTKMAKLASNDEFSEKENLGTNLNTPILFERGKFYELYSARRNERLKRKKEYYMELDETVAQDPEIAVELAKRRASKKAESLRKSVPANFSVSRANSLRSSVRNSKEMKKASAAVAASCEKKSAADLSFVSGRRVGTRSVRRI
ncbi:uncharacterized protein A4U43_C04F14130 [Asparagus officinalis]|uniref:Uncharacterized protein n=1 Tax=Asparagus officinalis TaxID=4686 RepID=A0A5P1F0R0_ASPOF|nr:uncharacterized protein LOC109837270 [Asparagus officinalis]ONK71956.1 uncharacterized protein A4U43_C04F14130 [Asparagus officinalis]